MQNDDLIAILGTRVEPVSHRPVGRMIAGSIAVGAALVVGAVLLALGMRPDLMQARVLVFFLAKLAFMIAVLLPASVFLIRLSRPGGERNTSVALLALPFIAVTALGAIALAFTPHAHWTQSLLGNQWLECLLSIPVIAIVPFAVIIWVVR